MTGTTDDTNRRDDSRGPADESAEEQCDDRFTEQNETTGGVFSR